MSGSWQLEIHDKEGNRIVHKEGLVDPFQDLIKAPPGNPLRAAAHLAASYGTQHNFGEAKLSFTVSVTCDQTTDMIDKAAQAVFDKSVELTERGMGVVMEAIERNKAGQ